MEYLAPDYPQEDSRMTQTRFLDLDRSLNCKRERFKVFKIKPKSNRDDVIINLIIISNINKYIKLFAKKNFIKIVQINIKMQ